MNGTPRLSSAFPGTPQTTRRRGYGQDGGNPQSRSRTSPLLKLPAEDDSQEEYHPVISPDLIDPATQRLSVLGVYIALWIWRLHDFYSLWIDDTESFWLFMKWVAIDCAFLYGLFALHIPWLEWSPAFRLVLFMGHAVLDGMLMFKIGLPLQSWIVAFIKTFWDSELAISERRVKPGHLLHNASLILGKQVIHILPEGSAALNPDGTPLCIGTTNQPVEMPILINQTTPIFIELLRADLNENVVEKIEINSKETRKLMKQALKAHKPNSNEPIVLKYPIRKTGLYKLSKIVDESRLEVRPRPSTVYVVQCPEGRFKESGKNKCSGELSNFVLEIEGTPPMRIKYRKEVNGIRARATLQGIQPDGFISPLSRHQSSGAPSAADAPDLSYAQPHRVLVPINETLDASGNWVYEIELVQDALGNAISYIEGPEESYSSTKKMAPTQTFEVHDRPRVSLVDCTPDRPLRVARGLSAQLPLDYSSSGSVLDFPLSVEYRFTPEEALLPNGEHSDRSPLTKSTIRFRDQKPSVEMPGLYTIQSVSSNFCEGDIHEPSSCTVLNPPEPSISVSTENIFDKCAGSPIGLRVSADLTGTPPFRVRVQIQKDGEKQPRAVYHDFRKLKGQFELTPPEAGSYTYTITGISDSVYETRHLSDKDLVIRQTVRPAASAHFTSSTTQPACIDESVPLQVRLLGEAPWALEYELVHAGKRKRQKVSNITDEEFTIETSRLSTGGEYTVALSSVTDKSGCRELLTAETKINVRHQRPKASFGVIDAKRAVKILTGKIVQLPIRLTGRPPFKVEFTWVSPSDPGNVVTDTQQFDKPNGILSVNKEGTYELVGITDVDCKGVVERQNGAGLFTVSSIPRPQLDIPASQRVRKDEVKYVKTEVCEGDEDYLELVLSGQPPFTVKYTEHHAPIRSSSKKLGYQKPLQGQKSLRKRELNPATESASIRMDTSDAGVLTYTFSELSDSNYDHDPKRHNPVTVEQTVFERPTAYFSNPGKTYSCCATEGDGDEIIPVELNGVPPFSIDVEIRHSGTARPEMLTFRGVEKRQHELRIPHSSLQLGHSSLIIRKVLDSRGCQSKSEVGVPAESSRVHISMHEAPSVSPMEAKTDYCVGEHLAFALSGKGPFEVFYNFKKDRKAKVRTNEFRRVADEAGPFTVTGIKDSSSNCRTSTHIAKFVRPLPAVRLSKGRYSVVDIHEGSEAEILFEFEGTPPFEFTYTRSTNAEKGRKSVVLESRMATSYEYEMKIKASEEGTYEVIAIRDKYCGYSKHGVQGSRNQKLLTE
ncbi:nuclear envelope pore membrane protein [Eremomyces bilateralis CBS 781.70]|uniref:Nuclear envelope pore membrane protein n=1 Tax=Eremomyces bilateralis CBS 781.70 TaxID=1392243 RepID=A0A6G1FZT6_9PEZI|nr:nuclear envelope pore membrane protein [Eremomyces bilateralis CBS 781.70]KAF1811191.1 nuclear envelope pore membrane protein [Eremomyces bilateralis CBS 781.70]